MAKPARTSRNRAIRNFQSAGTDAAGFIWGATDKAAGVFFRWITADHTGMSHVTKYMPVMGFLDNLRFLLLALMIQVAYAFMGGILIFLFIAFVIPYLLFGYI